MELNQESSIILKSILKRKYKTLEYIDDRSISIQEILNRIQKETSRKRPEENQKFIFKRSIKYLKKVLKKKSS